MIGSVAQRAELLERRSQACNLTDQRDAAVEAIQDALACRRQLGQRLEEGDALRRLSQILWCPGRTIEAERAARAAVTLSRRSRRDVSWGWPMRTLAAACGAAARAEEAVGWAGWALELAERLDDTEIAVRALATIGVCEAAEEKGWGSSSGARSSPSGRAG